MRVKMTNPRFSGEANVLPEDQAKWEAAGWVVAPNKKLSKRKEVEQ